MAKTKTLPWELDASGYFQDNYTIRRVVLFGTAGSLSIILPVLLLLFLNAQISQHPGPFDQPIDEMMAYTEFFLFITASYFSAAVLVGGFEIPFKSTLPRGSRSRSWVR